MADRCPICGNALITNTCYTSADYGWSGGMSYYHYTEMNSSSIWHLPPYQIEFYEDHIEVMDYTKQPSGVAHIIIPHLIQFNSPQHLIKRIKSLIAFM
jgi:hypothetical protein